MPANHRQSTYALTPSSVVLQKKKWPCGLFEFFQTVWQMPVVHFSLFLFYFFFMPLSFWVFNLSMSGKGLSFYVFTGKIWVFASWPTSKRLLHFCVLHVAMQSTACWGQSKLAVAVQRCKKEDTKISEMWTWGRIILYFSFLRSRPAGFHDEDAPSNSHFYHCYNSFSNIK